MEKAKLLIKEYDIPGEELSLIPIKTGHIGDTYKVSTKNGNFVLRIRHPGFTGQHVSSDHAFLKYLKEKGFPVPGICCQKDGKTHGLTEDKRIFELQEFIPHNSNLDDKSIRKVSSQLASFLGEYHGLAQSYPGDMVKMRYLGEIPLGFWEKYFLGPLEKGMERYERAGDEAGGKTGKELKTLTVFLGEELKKIQKNLERTYKEIPRLINHNDFYGNNILFQGEKIAGLVDFDFCATGIFYIDLMELLHGSMIWEDGEEGFWGLHPEGKIRVEQGRKDLALYGEKVPGLPIENDVLRDLLKVKVISLAWYPAFDLVDDAENRLEVAHRVKITLEEIEKFLP